MRTLLLLVPLCLVGCGEKKPPMPAPAEVDVSRLYLEPVPETVGRMTVVRPERSWTGPARVSVKSMKPALVLEAEDLDMAEMYEIRLESESPAAYGQVVGTLGPDTGTFERDGDRMTFSTTTKCGLGIVGATAGWRDAPSRRPRS